MELTAVSHLGHCNVGQTVCGEWVLHTNVLSFLSFSFCSLKTVEPPETSESTYFICYFMSLD